MLKSLVSGALLSTSYQLLIIALHLLLIALLLAGLLSAWKAKHRFWLLSFGIAAVTYALSVLPSPSLVQCLINNNY